MRRCNVDFERAARLAELADSLMDAAVVAEQDARYEHARSYRAESEYWASREREVMSARA